MDRHSHSRRSEELDLKLYSIIYGEVASVQHYGAFVKIPGYGRKNGLVHKTQISQTKVEKPEDVVEVGERVWCKIISMEDDGQKIGMSMKVVNQTTGKDLDPNHVQSSLDEQRRKTGHVKDIPIIQLGAVLDTTCKKCGGKGHFSQDCFHTEGGDTYELLPDVNHLVKQASTEVDQEKQSHKRKKDKKHKKKKKKHRKHSRGHSSDDSDDEPKEKKKKKEDKEKEKDKKEKEKEKEKDKKEREKEKDKKEREKEKEKDKKEKEREKEKEKREEKHKHHHHHHHHHRKHDKHEESDSDKSDSDSEDSDSDHGNRHRRDGKEHKSRH